MSVLHYCLHTTPIGEMLIAEADVRVAFAREDFDVVLGDLAPLGSIEKGVANVLLHVATHQLDEYFRGERKAFDLPLGADPGTPLKRAVREVLVSSKPGEVMTYKELAMASGFPSATRAVASACATNPLPVMPQGYSIRRLHGRISRGDRNQAFPPRSRNGRTRLNHPACRSAAELPSYCNTSQIRSRMQPGNGPRTTA